MWNITSLFNSLVSLLHKELFSGYALHEAPEYVTSSPTRLDVFLSSLFSPLPLLYPLSSSRGINTTQPQILFSCIQRKTHPLSKPILSKLNIIGPSIQ